MTQYQLLQRVVITSLAVLLLAPLSIFAEDRPDWRTRRDRSDAYDRRGDYDLQGFVVSVNRNGDDFLLRTGRRTIRIDARGGVPAYYGGRRYRIRDLERGDLVAVDLISTRGRYGYPRARRVEVLESVSHYGGYGRSGRNDRYDRYGRYQQLTGWIVSIDTRRDSLLVRTDSRRDVYVDLRGLRDSYGRDSARYFRRGDRVAFEGTFDGRTFFAERLSERTYDDRYNDRYGDRYYNRDDGD